MTVDRDGFEDLVARVHDKPDMHDDAFLASTATS